MNSPWPAPADHPPLAIGEVHIWAVPLDLSTARLDSLAAILSPDEQRRAADFRLAVPRRCFVVSRASLRILLGRYLDVAPLEVGITVDSYNKPRLADSYTASSLRFNVAHSGKLAIIAVTSDCELGVDVERRREVRRANHIAQRYFHPSEIAAIVAASAAERDIAFLRCWTGKEAVLKAIGTGITGSLAEFYIPDSAEIGVGVSIEVATHLHPQLVPCWVRRLDPDDEYLAALAIVGPQHTVRCMAFKP